MENIYCPYCGHEMDALPREIEDELLYKCPICGWSMAGEDVDDPDDDDLGSDEDYMNYEERE